MKLTAYLSGGMEFAENYGANWRTELSGWLGENLSHSIFDPVRASEKFLTDKYPDTNFRLTKLSNLARHREIAGKIVDLDCEEIILRSDYVICYYDESAQRGAGTKGELTIARVFGKPVYLVIGMEMERIPSWVLGCTDKIFNDFDSLKIFLLKQFANISPAKV